MKKISSSFLIAFILFFAVSFCLCFLAFFEFKSDLPASITTTKIDLQNPEMGKVYTGIVAEDCDFKGKIGKLQPLKVVIDNQMIEVSADISYPQVQPGYKKGQKVRFVFWSMALGSKPIPLLIPDFFEH